LVFLPCFLGEEVLGSVPWLSLFAPSPGERPRATEAATRKALLEIGQSIRVEAERKGPRWQYGVRLELLRLLFQLSRSWSPPAPAQAQGQVYSGNLSRIMPALTRLYEQPATELSRAEAARACGLGRSRFTTLFGETMGDSFVTVRQRVRLARAAALLLETGASVEEIAEQCGFSDASHLHRCFVREHSCTPGRYRDRAHARAPRRS
jgi:AraC-like DNA-binding protein